VSKAIIFITSCRPRHSSRKASSRVVGCAVAIWCGTLTCCTESSRTNRLMMSMACANSSATLSRSEEAVPHRVLEGEGAGGKINEPSLPLPGPDAGPTEAEAAALLAWPSAGAHTLGRCLPPLPL
jgi:hypothetical protein